VTVAALPSPVHVKICGLTTVEQALACVACGASAIGVNLVPSSKRRVNVARAREIARAVGGAALVVGIVADMSVEEMKRAKADAELGCLQLHGDEPPDALAELLPHAYKAVRVSQAADVARAATYPGEHVLLDGPAGGRAFDWSLAADLARARKVTLAGGLDPSNVAAAVRAVRPFCVDVASGVEAGVPGVKELARVRAFIENVRRA
jgi:phosphoribosylanthranilate isomerase